MKIYEIDPKNYNWPNPYCCVAGQAYKQMPLSKKLGLLGAWDSDGQVASSVAGRTHLLESLKRGTGLVEEYSTLRPEVIEAVNEALAKNEADWRVTIKGQLLCPEFDVPATLPPVRRRRVPQLLALLGICLLVM